MSTQTRQPTMTLRAWLRDQRQRPDPVGDVAREVLADRALRGRRLHPELLYRYVMYHGGDPALDAMLAAIGEYWSNTASPTSRYGESVRP
jgi:hypothetical protein